MKQVFLRATGGVLILLLSATSEPLLAQQAPTPNQQTPASNQPAQTTQPPIELPDNPGRAPAQTNTPSETPQQNAPQTSKQPSGTAVAPAIQVSGSAASKPAGAAIAPPKQHQVRTWLIRFGFIAGAGAALGTVAALSAASPGHVPGSGH
jgi:hypothetical protein